MKNNDALREALDQLGQYNVCMCEGGGSYDPEMADYHVKKARETLMKALAQQPAPDASGLADSTPMLHIGESGFESWYGSYNPAHKGDKQRARDAYAAGMVDPLVTHATTAAPEAAPHPDEFTCPLCFDDPSNIKAAKPETAERAEFENWLRSKWTAGYAFPKTADGQYTHGEAQRFWECWQAALLAADGNAGGESLESMLSTATGLMLGNKNRIGYLPGSVIDKEVQKWAERLKDWCFDDTYTHPHPQAEAVRVQMSRSERAEWWAVAMNAAASLESAASCLRDPDAKKSALGACEHVRQKCNRMWESAPKPQEK